MKKLIIDCLLISCVLFYFTQTVSGQDIPANLPAEAELINSARDIMHKAGTCSLITLDKEGLPSVRIMDPFIPEEDFIIWFGTNSKSRKVNQIQQNPNVSMIYFNAEAAEYVFIRGLAEIVNDPIQKQNRWKPSWEAFYPNREEAYTLIKVLPTSMEISSNARGILGDAETWSVPVIKLSND